MDFLGLHHPTFQPVWVRVAVVVFCMGWSVFEFLFGSAAWGAAIGALAVITAYKFRTIDYSKANSADKGEDNP